MIPVPYSRVRFRFRCRAPSLAMASFSTGDREQRTPAPTRSRASSKGVFTKDYHGPMKGRSRSASMPRSLSDDGQLRTRVSAAPFQVLGTVEERQVDTSGETLTNSPGTVATNVPVIQSEGQMPPKVQPCPPSGGYPSRSVGEGSEPLNFASKEYCAARILPYRLAQI